MERPATTDRGELEKRFQREYSTEAILRYVIERHPQVSHLVFTRYVPHNRSPENDFYTKLPVEACWENLGDGRVRSHIADCLWANSPLYAFAICSRVFLNDGSTAHIPMLDFDCEKTDKNQALIKSKLREVGEEEGAIIDSGESYHYMGFRLISEQDWVEFLGNTLLMNYQHIGDRLVETKLVDPCFIGYSLKRGGTKQGFEDYRCFGSLRLNSSWPNKKLQPVFVELL